MPIYRTSAEVSIDDLMAQIEMNGEKVIQILPRQGRYSFRVFTEKPVNDTGRVWAPDRLLGQTNTPMESRTGFVISVDEARALEDNAT